jgi:hypothetical protein
MSIRGYLADMNDPSKLLTFQYNPSGIQESKQANWAEAAIPGGDDTLATFGNGGSLQVTFQLFLNAYGEGRRLPSSIEAGPGDGGISGPDISASNKIGDREYVEKALEFLYRYTEVDAENLSFSAPPILLLVLGRMRFRGSRNMTALPVRLVQMSVERIIFDPADFVTLRATADLTFVRHVGFPQ